MHDLSKFRIEMYADGADLNSIKDLRGNPLVKGFTTNPTLMKAAGIKDYLEFAKVAIDIVNPLPISLEVFADDFSEMQRQAQLLNSLNENIFVKIPITNTKGESSNKLIHDLSFMGINLNITAIFTKAQIDSVLSSIDANQQTILSIFAGRIADAGVSPIPTMKYAIQKTEYLPNVKVLWASPREIFNLIEAEDSNCDIITMTPDLWKKIPNLGKDLNKFSIETVEMFYKDALASGYFL